MKKIAFLIIFIALVFNVCYGQKHKLDVTFKIDDKIKSLVSPSLLFVFKDRVYAAKFKGCELLLPKIPSSIEHVDVFFKSGNYKMKFKSVVVKSLIPNQDFNWTFAIMNRDFEKVSSDFDTKTLLKLYIWEFNPMQHGDGILITNPVYK